MLETVDFTQDKLDKEYYKTERDALLERLVVLQQQARSAGIGLVVLFEGWNGSGKGSRISDLMYHLDARATTVSVTPDLDFKERKAFDEFESGVQGFFPSMQQFWQSLGMRGTMTIYDRGWYTCAMQNMLYNEADRLKTEGSEQRTLDALRISLSSAADFERQLVDDGYVIVKFFVHISKKEQKKRLSALKDDPTLQWRVKDADFKEVKNYDRVYRMYDNLLEGSDFSYAPWHVLNGEDRRRANLQITRTLVKALEDALNAGPDEAALAAAQKAQANSAGALQGIDLFNRTPEQEEQILEAAKEEAKRAAKRAPRSSRFKMSEHIPSLSDTDHTLCLDFETYKEELKREQERLYKLELEMFQKRIPLMIMYEGWDAAGKGGNIKRVAQALDARAYTIFPSPAPTKPELLHPHLWRYWTRLPKAGHVGIYDRSWYGRVLVERVEGFASETEWSRAYDEINEFERDMVNWGAILLKFWVDISPEEQLARFQARQEDPSKQWKITDEDWRNRDKTPQYEAAIEDMFRLTSTEFAPWIILESDDKRYARIKALKIINNALEERLRER